MLFQRKDKQYMMPTSDDTAQIGPREPQEGREGEKNTTQAPLEAGVAQEAVSPPEMTDVLPQTQEASDAPVASPPIQEMPLTQRELLERESGRGIWLMLAIGSAGLLLTLLLPWIHVYYLNPMQDLVLGPNDSITFTKDEVVHVVISGWQLLTSDLWPFLLLVLLTIVLFGTVVYWRRARFTRARVAWLALALSLIVGVGFPIALQQMLAANQRVTWTNAQATIEHNAGHTFDKSGAVYICIPKDRSDHSCDKDYSHGIILNAGIDWKETASDKQQGTLVQGHADGVRAAYNSAHVTTSGYAVGTFGALDASYGYWISWIFSLLVLLNALILLRRLLRVRRAPHPAP
jgi:hypothetical protein